MSRQPILTTQGKMQLTFCVDDKMKLTFLLHGLQSAMPGEVCDVTGSENYYNTAELVGYNSQHFLWN